jgi:hypothetical protein
MFKGKIVYYENINGKEEKFEKEFDDQKEYADFINSSDDSQWDLCVHTSHWYPHGSWLWPKWTVESFSRPDSCSDASAISKKDGVFFESAVDISKYEKAEKKMENDKKNVWVKKEKLKETKEKLEGFLEKFKTAGKLDLVKDIESDLEKVEQELAAL